MNAVNQASLPLFDTVASSRDLTIADALETLGTWSDLPANRLQKMRTALATAARILAPHQDKRSGLATVPVTCRSLSRLLQTPPATFGLSASRMTSLCSELRFVMRRLGRHQPSRRGVALTVPELLACQALLPRFHQMALMDFLRFLESEAIDPATVEATTITAYRTLCSERTLCEDPAARARRVTSSWNWACKERPTWPGKPIVPMVRGDRYTFPLCTYPVAFQQDVERYAERLRGHDIEQIFEESVFGGEGSGTDRFQRPLRPTSINGRVWSVRCAAAALVIMGVEQSAITSLRDLVTPIERAKTIIQFYLKRNGKKEGQSSPMSRRIAQTLLLVARDYCALPETEVAKLALWKKRVKAPDPHGLTDKNTKRLRGLMQPRARAMLLWLPQELIRRAAAPSLSPAGAARLVMYAVAMEILLICPMRRKNLAELRLDHHLYRPDPRQKRLTHLVISADEVKNGTPIQWPIPPESARLIESFIARHRPHLVHPGNPYLFGTGDRPRAAQPLGEWLAMTVTQELGVEFNVHLARHFAAWNFLRQNPGQYEVVRQVLGHRSIAVTMAHYVGLEAASAAEHFDASVLHDRQAVRKVAINAFRRGIGSHAGGLRRRSK